MNHKHEEVIQFLYAHESPFVGKRVLDAGGRDGLIIDSVDGADLKVVLDLNREELKKSKTPEKIVADITSLPFADQSFDLAIFSEVLEHLAKPQDGVNELARTCTAVVMTTPNNCALRRLLWKLRRKSELSASGHVREYSPTEARGFFREAGFELTLFEGIGFIIGKVGMFRSLGRKLAYLSSKVLMRFSRRHST